MTRAGNRAAISAVLLPSSGSSTAAALTATVSVKATTVTRLRRWSVSSGMSTLRGPTLGGWFGPSEVWVRVGLAGRRVEADDDACPVDPVARRLQLEQPGKLAAQGGAQLGQGAIEERRVGHAAREPFQFLAGAPAGLDMDELEAISCPGDARACLQIGCHVTMVRPVVVERFRAFLTVSDRSGRYRSVIDH